MERNNDQLKRILNYLQGGQDIDIRVIARSKSDSALLVRTIVYMMKQKYHRSHMINAILAVMSYSEPIYRDAAYEIIQRMQLSHLSEIPSEIKKNSENSRRLRHAIVNKIIHSNFGEIYYAYFIATSKFRDIFEKLYLPKEKISDKEIKNKKYLTALKLSKLPVQKAVEMLVFSKVRLVRDLGIPLEKVMPLINSKEDGIEVAKFVKADNFFRHGRWFKDLVGIEEYEVIGKEKVASVKNPISFLANQKHLVETGSITPDMLGMLQERAEAITEEFLKKYDVKKLALIVDISGSMHTAITLTQKLYETFQYSMKFTDLIAFESNAFIVNRNELSILKPRGSTSIGSSIVLLAKEIQKRKFNDIPDGIILVTDLGENCAPYLKNALKLLYKIGDVPLIILRVRNLKLQIDYPHAIIDVTEFHDSLMMDIVRQIVKLTAMVTTDKETTKILKQRKPIEEVISEIKLPIRDEKNKEERIS
jgi:hypothetical protein